MSTNADVAMPTTYTTIEFHGASDDLIEINGKLPDCDEYSYEHGVFELCGLRVELDYLPHGCWSIRVAQISERDPVSARDITLSVGGGEMTPEVLAGLAPVPASGYSMVLRMSVPTDTRIHDVSGY